MRERKEGKGKNTHLDEVVLERLAGVDVDQADVESYSGRDYGKRGEEEE
jgi:hypothetical protein